MKRKLARSIVFPQNITTFAKNTAHNERRLRKNVYLCRRGGKTVAVTTFNVDSREYIWQR
jgi:hypothetical protein